MAALLNEVQSTQGTLNDLLQNYDTNESRIAIPLFNEWLEHSSVVEIHGPPASGKTHFMMSIIMRAILPSSWRGVELQGLLEAVVLYDMDGKWDSARFLDVTIGYIIHLFQEEAIRHGDQYEPEPEAIQSLVVDCMQHLHIFRPSSTLAAVDHAKSLHSCLARTTSTQKRLGFVVVDSLSAFYWQDRLARGGKDSINSDGDLVNALSAQSKKFGATILASSWSLDTRMWPSHTVALLKERGDTHLWCKRIDATQFLPDMAVMDAQKDANFRKEVTDRGEFLITVVVRQELRGSTRFFVKNNSITFA